MPDVCNRSLPGSHQDSLLTDDVVLPGQAIANVQNPPAKFGRALGPVSWCQHVLNITFLAVPGAAFVTISFAVMAYGAADHSTR